MTRDFTAAIRLLDDAIADRVFPGAAVAVTYRGELVLLHAAGRFTYDESSPAVTTDTIYDLASVTKVVATTTIAMVLHERGILDLNAPAPAVLPEFATTSPHDASVRQDITIRMLLTHSSGLPGYVRLFERAWGHDEMLRAACSLPIEASPGSRAEYSDPGFILLGEILQRLAGEPLDRFCEREIFHPLGMAHTRFCPPAEWKSQVPPTEEDRTYRRRVIQGEVQDENASAMGGLAGHAGLFAPAADVARFAECMLRGGNPILRPATIELFTRREISPPGTSRALGWDTPSKPSQSGQYFSSRSFGHLGYAGTSLWIDPDRRLSVVLLTNRTWPDRQNQAIKQFRPRFHDAIVELIKRS